MPETLSIAELPDGRQALAYRNPEEGRGELVAVLHARDLRTKPAKAKAHRAGSWGLEIMDPPLEVDIPRIHIERPHELDIQRLTEALERHFSSAKTRFPTTRMCPRCFTLWTRQDGGKIPLCSSCGHRFDS